MPSFVRSFAIGSCLLASSLLFACVSDSPVGVQPADAAPAADTGTDATVDARVDAAADAPQEAEAGPPTPTGKLIGAFQSRGDGDSDSTAFFSGDIAPPVTFDAQGNAYFAGSFTGTASFGDPNATTCTLTAKGGANDSDAYVAKIDPKGNCLAAARIGGALTFDTARALAVSAAGTVVVFGQLTRLNGTGAFGWSINGGADTTTTNGAFLVGLSAADLSFKFSQDMLPQSNATEPRAVAIGPGGTIAVSGSVPIQASYQFQNGGGTVTSNGPNPGYQAFVAEYQTNGQLSFARVLTVKTLKLTCISTGGGVGYAPNGDLLFEVRALGQDTCDFVANSGTIASNPPADWTTGPVAVEGGTAGTTSYLVLRYDPKNAGAFKGKYQKAFVGSGGARGMTVTPSGDVYALTSYFSSVGFKFGSTTVAPTATGGALLLHFDANLGELGAKFLQGSANASSVVVDPFGSVVVGGTANANLDFGNGKTAPFLGDTADVFVAKFDPTLANCLWLNAYATSAREDGAGLAVSSTGTIAFHGAFQGATMPLNGSVTLANKSAGTYDGFGGFLEP